MTEALTIGNLGRATGTNIETIRYYERIGLLNAAGRTGGNYRKYGSSELRRLSFIRRARDLGFSIEEIRALLALTDHRDRPCNAVNELVQKHLTEVEQKIADLTALRRELRSLVSQCRTGTIRECRILDALAPNGY